MGAILTQEWPQRFAIPPSLEPPKWVPGDIRLAFSPVGGLQKLAGSGTVSFSLTGAVTKTPSVGGMVYKHGWDGAATRIISLGSDSSILLNTSSGLMVGVAGSSSLTVLYNTSYTGGAPGSGGFDIVTAWPAVGIGKTDITNFCVVVSDVQPGQPYAFAWSYNSSTGRARVACNGKMATATSAQTFSHSTAVFGSLQGNSTRSTEQNLAYFLLSGAECFDDEYLLEVSRNPARIFDSAALDLIIPTAAAASFLPVWALGSNASVIGSGIHA